MFPTILFLQAVLLHTSIQDRLHSMCNNRSAIYALGGPSKVARDYGFKVQRVCNWGTRGIPARVILDNEAFAKALEKAGYDRLNKAAA